MLTEMKKIKFGELEVSDHEGSPILLAATKNGAVVWTHLHREIDSIAARRFNSESDARQYARALASLLNRFIQDAETLIKDYNHGEAIQESAPAYGNRAGLLDRPTR